jgi:DNA-directed RNA polymerase
MTSQYNAGPSTLGESYFDALKGTEVNGELIFDRATAGEKLRIGRLILEASENEFPEGFRTRTVLNQLAEAHTLSGKMDIELRTPNVGNPFRQSYLKAQTRQVELDDGAGGIINVEVRVETNEMDWAKQERAFAPNIIHAFDAEHKSLVVNAMAKHGVKDFSMIHDSFRAHAGNMSLMKKATKEAFVDMYKKENILEKLYNHFKSQGVEMVKYSRDSFGRKIRATKKTVLSKGQSTREIDGRIWVIENIDKKDILELGSYDFRDFDKLDYFFH